MANRTRKRIYAIRRAPDGSAFEKCDCCGISVAIALSDMHECQAKRKEKRPKGPVSNPRIGGSSISNQPRSPFCFFMERFKQEHKSGDWIEIEIDQMGFQKWNKMSEKERCRYIIEAKRVNSDYQRILLKEMDYTSEGDDEADSAMVGKIDSDYENYMDRGQYSNIFESFDTDYVYLVDPDLIKLPW